MITVVSDTSPINYLILIEAIDVLPRLFQEIFVPPAVIAELRHSRTPKPVFDWVSALPAWMKIQPPTQIDNTIGLGAGETEAISLALEVHALAVLMDERRGRLEALKRGMVPVETLNILDTADARGLLSFEDAAHKLKQTSFRIDPAIIDALIQRARQRKRI